MSVILYPPEEFIGIPGDEVLRRTIVDAMRLGVDLRGRVRRYRVVSRPQDFYRIAVGAEALRPEQQTPVPGLTVAGDYTRQPFLASMEGAVISGRLAAEVVVKSVRA